MLRIAASTVIYAPAAALDRRDKRRSPQICLTSAITDVINKTITGVNMRVSSAEGIVMEALWRRHPLGADEIASEVAPGQGWSEATVKSLLNRLLSKGAIAAEKDGRRYLYRPQLAREDYLTAESANLIDRLFDGRVSSLVTHFSEREKLSADDIAELKRLIAELDNER